MQGNNDSQLTGRYHHPISISSQIFKANVKNTVKPGMTQLKGITIMET